MIPDPLLAPGFILCCESFRLFEFPGLREKHFGGEEFWGKRRFRERSVCDTFPVTGTRRWICGQWGKHVSVQHLIWLCMIHYFGFRFFFTLIMVSNGCFKRKWSLWHPTPFIGCFETEVSLWLCGASGKLPRGSELHWSWWHLFYRAPWIAILLEGKLFLEQFFEFLANWLASAFFCKCRGFCEFAESCLEHFGWEKSTIFCQPNINRVAKIQLGSWQNWCLNHLQIDFSGQILHHYLLWLPPPKFNSSPLKNGGKRKTTFLSYWGFGHFSGANC